MCEESSRDWSISVKTSIFVFFFSLKTGVFLVGTQNISTFLTKDTFCDVKKDKLNPF